MVERRATAVLEAKLEAERSKVALSRAFARRNMRRRLTAILADQRRRYPPPARRWWRFRAGEGLVRFVLSLGRLRRIDDFVLYARSGVKAL